MLWHGKNFRGIINKAKEMIFDNTGTDLISTNAEDAIKEVNSNLLHTLWTNPNPTQAFDPSNITLSSSDYDLLLFVFKSSASDNDEYSYIVNKGFGCTANYIYLSGGNPSFVRRNVTYVNDTQYSVDNNYKVTISSGSQTVGNTGLIPYKVYGMKVVN